MVRRNVRRRSSCCRARPGLPFAGNDDGANTQVGKVLFDGGFAVTTVGGHGAGCATGPGFDPVDCGSQLWCVGGVSGLHVVIEHDAVVVVDDLPLVAELDGFAQPALGDRAGIAVVQADHPGRSVRGGPGDALPGLSDDPRGRLQQVRQVVHGAGQPTTPAPRGGIPHARLGQLGRLGLCSAQRPSGVAQQTVRVARRGLGEVGELTGDPRHAVVDLVTAQLAAGPQFRRDPVGALSRQPATGPASWCGSLRRRTGSAAR